MPPLPLLLLLPGLLLLNLVEADDQQLAEYLLKEGRVEQIGSESSSLSPSENLITLPAVKLSKEDRQARKLLRKKKKRLRELREEIRKMGRASGAFRTVKLTRSRDEKWRRRMLVRLDAITRRLDRLETLIMESSSKSSSKNKDAETRKMDRHFASVSRSLNGEVGMACTSHRDCRPGRCCHAAATTASAAAAAAATCVQHDSSEATSCSDSCQCTLQLQCFAPKTNSTQSACKRAASSDILNGTYLNDPNGIF